MAGVDWEDPLVRDSNGQFYEFLHAVRVRKTEVVPMTNLIDERILEVVDGLVVYPFI